MFASPADDTYQGTITINDCDYQVLARSIYADCVVTTYAKHINGEKTIQMLVRRDGVAVNA